MKRAPFFYGLFFFIGTVSAVAQTTPSDPYKPVLDRLQAITTMPLDNWLVLDSDLPHGETPDSALSQAKSLALKQNLQLPVWLYENVEVPSALKGNAVAGSRVSLDLNIGGNTGILISVFVNGNMVARGDERFAGPDHADPIRATRPKATDCCPHTPIGHCRLLRRAAGNPHRIGFAGLRSAEGPSRSDDPPPGNHGRRATHRRLSRRQS